MFVCFFRFFFLLLLKKKKKKKRKKVCDQCVKTKKIILLTLITHTKAQWILESSCDTRHYIKLELTLRSNVLHKHVQVSAMLPTVVVSV